MFYILLFDCLINQYFIDIYGKKSSNKVSNINETIKQSLTYYYRYTSILLYDLKATSCNMIYKPTPTHF